MFSISIYQKKLILAILAFAGALFLNYYASQYAFEVGQFSCAANDDLFQGWLPHYDLSRVFVWGYAVFMLIMLVTPIMFERERIPYYFWMFAAFITLRCFFIILTPLNLPPGDSPIPDGTLYNDIGKYLSSHYDLFFSAHTSMPFLGFLIVKNKPLRIVMLLLSLILATTVLIGRYHYSVDVFAAFFMTYAFVQLQRNIIGPWFNKLNIL